MQVNRIQSNNYNNQPNFKALIVTEEGAKVLRKLYIPAQLKRVAKFGKELENTKHFDLRISAFGDDLFYVLEHKTNPRLDCEAPLYPHTLKGNKLCAYGTDLLDTEDIFIYGNLRFPTVKEAEEAGYKLLEHAKESNRYLDPINSLERFEWAVDSTKILDRATEYTGSDAIVYEEAKPSITQQLKNAWQTLKGN